MIDLSGFMPAYVVKLGDLQGENVLLPTEVVEGRAYYLLFVERYWEGVRPGPCPGVVVMWNRFCPDCGEPHEDLCKGYPFMEN